MIIVALEGIDGAGKTTLSRAISRHLTRLDVPHTLTREPWYTPHGEMLRRGSGTLTDALKDRAEHTRQVIAPALIGGRVVVVDRYIASTAVYSAPTGQDCAVYRRLMLDAPAPVTWLWLDTRPEECLLRCQSRGERETLAGLRALRARYSALPWTPVRLSDPSTADAAPIAVEVCRHIRRIMSMRVDRMR